VLVPAEFFGVGQWYQDFSQTTDAEVQQLLGAMSRRETSAVT
jgi:predicted phosphoribosyltransferase